MSSIKDVSAEASRPDRRTQRTRASLRDALLILMAERGWDEVSVQDICARAHVGRSTFYSHFTGKEALLTGGFDDLRLMITEGWRQARKQGSTDDLPPFAFIRGLLDHAHENRELFRALVGKRSGVIVQMRFKDMLVSLVDQGMQAWPAGVPRAAAVCWTAGALFELLVWWLDGRNPMTPDEINQVFLTMVHHPAAAKYDRALAAGTAPHGK